MADIIAVAIGRGKDTETESTRLASREAEVKVQSWRTSVQVIMQKDGRTMIRILRDTGGGPRAHTCLSEIHVNSELADSTIITADGVPMRVRTEVGDRAE